LDLNAGALGPLGIRYTIPKKDVVFNRNDPYVGKLVGSSHVDCILFDTLQIWRDDDICYYTNYYYTGALKEPLVLSDLRSFEARWRRVNPIIKD
jgi:hypothetical protein